MPTSIIGLFETQDIARKVVSALGKAGFDDDKIETMTKAGIDETTDRLVEAGYDKDKARRYGEAIQKAASLSSPMWTTTRPTKPSARCGSSTC